MDKRLHEMDGEKFMTVEETAEVLKCCPATVRDSIRRGDIPAVRVGREYRVSRQALDERAGLGSAKREIAESVSLALLPKIATEVARVMRDGFGRIVER